ncbi:MAG: hypothetical protein ACKV2U_28255 [Bryobacteraceae bacterium]
MSDQEWSKLWRQDEPPLPDTQALVRDLAARSEKLRRQIRNRNLREYGAGALVTAMLAPHLFHPERWPIALSGILIAAGVLGYLWRQHRDDNPADQSMDSAAYGHHLLASYDRQIRLLSRVKYWYVAPMWAWMTVVTFSSGAGRTATEVTLRFCGVTAFSGFVVWLNESYGVRKLRAERALIESMLSERK